MASSGRNWSAHGCNYNSTDRYSLRLRPELEPSGRLGAGWSLTLNIWSHSMIIHTNVFGKCSKPHLEVWTELYLSVWHKNSDQMNILQVEGAFVQGLGFFMFEEYLANSDGMIVTDGTWTYKIPTIDVIPRKFNVELLNSGHHQQRVLSSKGIFATDHAFHFCIPANLSIFYKQSTRQTSILWDTILRNVPFLLHFQCASLFSAMNCILYYISREEKIVFGLMVSWKCKY